jgi:hypothetical protein
MTVKRFLNEFGESDRYEERVERRTRGRMVYCEGKSEPVFSRMITTRPGTS